MIKESKKDKWLEATMKPPSFGTFSSPVTYARQTPWMMPRIDERVMV